MHTTAMVNCKQFFACYGNCFAADAHATVKVIDIGSQDVNGSLRDTCPAHFDYTGVDFVAGKGVDIVLRDPYTLPFETSSVDIALSSSCFEHAEMFWVLFLEIMRVLKPRGLFYLNVPSNGIFHRFPVDCWRFYPDSGRALIAWAKRNGIPAALLESYTSAQNAGQFNDFVAVFLKDETLSAAFPNRILDRKKHFTNGIVYGAANNDFINYSAMTEEQKKLLSMQHMIHNNFKIS